MAQNDACPSVGTSETVVVAQACRIAVNIAPRSIPRDIRLGDFIERAFEIECDDLGTAGVDQLAIL